MRHFKYWVLLVAPMLIISACKKGASVHPTAPQTSKPGMSFKVNGTLVNTLMQGASLSSTDSLLNVSSAYNTFNSNLVFTISKAQVGTYDVAKDHVRVTVLDYGTTYQGSTGTFAITALSDTSVSGTFQFAADVSTGAKLNVTEGQFHIPVHPAPGQ